MIYIYYIYICISNIKIYINIEMCNWVLMWDIPEWEMVPKGAFMDILGRRLF